MKQQSHRTTKSLQSTRCGLMLGAVAVAIYKFIKLPSEYCAVVEAISLLA